MKVAVVADCHLGNHKRFGGEVIGSINARGRLSLDVFRAAVTRAAQTKCTHFVVAGDLFDYARPEPALIYAVQEIMRGGERDAAMGFVLLVGNHDRTSTAESDNALAPLAPYATIVEKPVSYSNGLVLVPFQAGVASNWLPEVLASLGDPQRKDGLLVLHMGVRDDKTPPWLREAPGAIPARELLSHCQDAGFACALAGDWHEHRSWKRDNVRAMQIGALCPTGWDNPGVEGYGSLITWEPGKPPTRYEVPGPRFVKVTNDEERQAALAAAKQHTIFISETCAPDQLFERMGGAETLRLNRGIGGVEVLADQTIAKADARMAGVLARSAETLDEALTNFVAAMPLPEDVDRAPVLEKCKEFLL